MRVVESRAQPHLLAMDRPSARLDPGDELDRLAVDLGLGEHECVGAQASTTSTDAGMPSGEGQSTPA